ncbi:unnamed protein product [Amaranthus hypochondriacus]
MAQILFLVTLFVTLAQICEAKSFKALVAPIRQLNPSTFVYTITLNQKEKLVIDLESPYSWHHCSKSSPRVSCNVKECYIARTNQRPCVLHSPKTFCITSPSNPISNSSTSSYLSYTNVSIAYTDGHVPFAKANYKLFLSCAPKSLLNSRPIGSSGFASFSRSLLSLVKQFSNSKVPRKFGMCLGEQGVAFFGEGPFYLLPPPGRDITRLLSSTPLITHPNDNLGHYIGLKGISINGEAIKSLRSKLPFDKLVKLSTITPYTILRSDLYRAVIRKFSEATRGIPRVPKVAPFGLCLNTSNLGSTRVGLPVPQIDLQLIEGGNWTIFGANSMVQVSNDAHCLAFVNGGKRIEQGAVIGSYQMQHNFLLFDLVNFELGFSSLLFFFQTTCNNFNFTSGL